MHYYQFNIGDYIKSTYHLDDTEDLIYRRLLDLCYNTEKPLPKCHEEVARLIRMKGNPDKTQAVLSEFFKLTKHGWIQKRIQEELSKYSAKAQTARENGNLGGRPVGTQKKPARLAVGTQKKANQEPITTNQEPKKIGRFTPPEASTVYEYMLDIESNQTTCNTEAMKFHDHYSSNGWKVGRNPMKDWKATARNWIRRNANGKDKQFTRQSKSDRHDEAAREYAESLSEDDDGSLAGIGGYEAPH